MHFELISIMEYSVEFRASRILSEMVFKNFDNRKLFVIYVKLLIIINAREDCDNFQGSHKNGQNILKVSDRMVRNYFRTGRKNNFFVKGNERNLRSLEEIFDLPTEYKLPLFYIRLGIREMENNVCVYVIRNHLKEQDAAIRYKLKNRVPVQNPYLVLTHEKIKELLDFRSTASGARIKKILLRKGVVYRFPKKISESAKLKRFKKKNDPDFFFFLEKK